MDLVFGLDLSYHAGWCVFDTQEKLIASGTINLPGKVGDDYGPFPWNYLNATTAQINQVYDLICRYNPKAVVIEAVNKGKNRWSQLGLDFLHLELLQRLKLDGLKVVYLDSSAWRRTMDIKMSPTDKKNNAKVSKAKRGGKSKKELGVKGKVTKKHLAINAVNQMIREGKLPLEPLKLKDNDEAESLLLCLAYLRGCPHSDPKKKER